MIRFKQLIGLFVLGILHLGCDADELREKRITKARLRRQGDLNEWRILSSKKVSLFLTSFELLTVVFDDQLEIYLPILKRVVGFKIMAMSQ